METLDIAFVSKFIAPQYRKFVIDSLTKIFKTAIINDKKLKMDVAIILDSLIRKEFSDNFKLNQLMERIDISKYQNEMKRIIYCEFEDELGERTEKYLNWR